MTKSKFEISIRVPLIIEAESIEKARQTAQNIIGENFHFFNDMFEALENDSDNFEPSIYAAELSREGNPERHDFRALFITHNEDDGKSVYHKPDEFDSLIDELDALHVDYRLTACPNLGVRDGLLMVECQYSVEELEIARESE